VKDEKQNLQNIYEPVCADKRQAIVILLPFILYPLFFTLFLFLSSCGKPDTALRQSLRWQASPITAEDPASKREEDSARSQYYKFITPLSRSEEDKVIARVEAFHAELSKAFAPGIREMKVATVEILQDKAAFDARVAAGKPEVTEPDSALFVKDRIILAHLGADTQALFRALYRHQTRLYLYDLTRKFPLWIEEGIVSFFEEVSLSVDLADPALQGRYIITGYSADKMERLQTLLASGKYPDFRGLVQITQKSDFTEEHRLISWGFAYWAQVGGPNTNRVVYKNYLRAVLEKGAENVNIEDFLGMTLEEFQKKWQNWILKQEIYKKGGEK
jgi:hypothetical protein